MAFVLTLRKPLVHQSVHFQETFALVLTVDFARLRSIDLQNVAIFENLHFAASCVLPSLPPSSTPTQMISAISVAVQLEL